MFSTAQVSILETVADQARRQSLRVFVVGGLVRDILLGCDLRLIDLDFLVEGDAIAFGHACNSRLNGTFKEFSQFQTCKIISPALAGSVAGVDFATARTEIYQIPGALPVVKPASGVLEDLKRRDFSINAMALEVSLLLAWYKSGAVGEPAGLLDSFSGREDLGNRLIRVLHPGSFSDDPTRIFRAFRYASRLDGKVEETTLGLLERALAAGALNSISAFRLQNELKKICAEKGFAGTFEMLEKSGALACAGFPWPAEKEDLSLAMRRLAMLVLSSDSNMVFEVFLALSFGRMTAESASRLSGQYSMGRRKFEALQEAFRLSDSGSNASPGALSDLALLLRLIRCAELRTEAELLSEGVHRGLLKSGSVAV